MAKIESGHASDNEPAFKRSFVADVCEGEASLTLTQLETDGLLQSVKENPCLTKITQT